MIRGLVFAVAVVAFLVAACGGEEASPAPSSSPEVRSAPSPSPGDGQPVAFATPSPAPGDGQPTPPAVRTMEFETIEKGQHSGIGGQEPQVFKVDTQAAWEEFWSRHQAVITPAPPLPAVDFSQEMVIAAVDGQEPSGGYRLEITGMEEIEDGLLVRVRKEKPGQRCIVAAAITQPFHIVRTPKSDLEPQLAVSEETYSCE